MVVMVPPILYLQPYDGPTYLQSYDDAVSSNKERGEGGESDVPWLNTVLENNL